MVDLSPTRDGQQILEERLDTETEHLEQEEETESEDSGEEWPPDSDPGRHECAEEVREELLQKFNDWNDRLLVKKEVPRCLLREGQSLLPYCMPAALSELDARFHEEKKQRVFVCDTLGCRQEVRFSNDDDAKETGYRRADCEFAGSFIHRDWDDLPPRFREEAWTQRLIDASWQCTHMCGAPTTLNFQQKQRRLARIRKYQQQTAATTRRPARTSSSAASGAKPPRGKGAKGKSSADAARGKGAQAGQRKRTWAEMARPTSKGMKKGGSTQKGQASQRWRW